MQIKNQCLSPIALPKQLPGRYKNYKIFRCGKCPACLRQKANELIVRSREEWQGRNVHFLTFTYRYDTCPLFNVDWYFVDDKKVVQKSWLSRDTDLVFNSNAPFILKYDKKGNEFRRYMPIMTTSQDLISYNGVFQECTHVHYQYWTIDSGDMQLLIKRFRKRFPGVLQSYIYVPEYGGLTYHPHYHLMTFGLNEEHVVWFRENWPYGTVDIDYPGKHKKYSNVPIYVQQEKITRYVAKYCTKGKYDCPYIAEGLCIKPRRSVSQNFGIPDIDKLRNYLCATDITKVDDPFFVDDCPPLLDDKCMKVLVSRRTWDINGFKYPVPKYFIDKVFRRSVYFLGYRNVGKEFFSTLKNDPNKKYRYVKTKQITSPLQKEIGHYILADLINDYDRKSQENTIDTASNLDTFSLARSIEVEQKNNFKVAELQFKTEIEESRF